MLPYLKSETHSVMDAVQFAYKVRRGVEDATVTLLNKVYNYLKTPSSYVRIFFADFSSAFNTVRTNLLADKLSSLGVNHTLIR